MFLSYIACHEQLLTFGSASLRKYFFDIQPHKGKSIQTHIYTFKSTAIQSKSILYHK